MTDHEVDFAVRRINGPGAGLSSQERSRQDGEPKGKDETFHRVFLSEWIEWGPGVIGREDGAAACKGTQARLSRL